MGALLVHVNIRAPFFLTGLLLALECLWVLRALRITPLRVAQPEHL